MRGHRQCRKLCNTMRIDSRDLHGLPVVTQLGKRLGKILFFEMDIETHAVLLYHVGTRHWPAGERYLITPAQVDSITEKEMVVKGDVRLVDTKESAPVRAPVTRVSPVATRGEG